MKCLQIFNFQKIIICQSNLNIKLSLKIIIFQMKKHYKNSRQKGSREKSYDRDRHRHHRSKSRSRQKRKKQKSRQFGNGRQTYRVKTQSDIKNHYRFKLPNISVKQEQDTISMLKSKLNEHIGPVEHISRSRQPNLYNLGFKYDIDALSFLQQGNRLTIKISAQKINLDPIPTKIFQDVINEQRHQYSINQKKPIHKKSKSKSYSSSSSSHRKSYRSESRSNKSFVKLQIYGIPSQISQEKFISYLKHYAPGGPYKIDKSSWKNLGNSACEYLQIRVNSQKADTLLQISNKIQVEGRPILIVEDSQRPSKQLVNFQVLLHFPKAVHPSKVIKYIQKHAKVVQIVATQQFQQDGKCKGYILTLNDAIIANSLKKLAQISCGIKISQPKNGQYVYRPVQLLPDRHQL